MVDDLPEREIRHGKMLQDVLVNDRIIYPGVPPRRVWDLCSNRVVPWWVTQRQPWGISHGWMDEEDREDILTPINRREWPVPVPKGTSLDQIRIEMLNLGAEYAWLDVLCLRQKGGIREDLREDEWKVDVPTIGHVYRAERVVYYLSGLGRPLSSDADNSESDRCWFKRAWTLQEISWDPIIGGGTGDEELQTKFEEQLSSLQDIRGGRVYDVLSEMQKRVSTHPVDKIAGMAYLLGSDSIPAYYGKQSEVDAWIALIDVTANWCQADLLFLHPTPGNGTQSWRPLWKQAMAEQLPLRENSEWGSPWIEQCDIDVKTGSCSDGYIIESALVLGLYEGDSQGQERHGKLVVEDSKGTEHTFKIVARHQCPISDNSYTLLGADSEDFKVIHWVVGWRLPDQRLKKLSVFEMYEDTEFARLSLCTRVNVTYLA